MVFRGGFALVLVAFVLSHELCATLATLECPSESTHMKSTDGYDKVKLVLKSQVMEDLDVLWINKQGKEQPADILSSMSVLSIDTYIGHAFRLRTTTGEVPQEGTLVWEHVIPPGKTSEHETRRDQHEIFPCGPLLKRLVDNTDHSSRSAEFEALVHDLQAPCEPANASAHWSCVRYLGVEDIATRDPAEYGFQPGEVVQNNVYRTTAVSEVDQIMKIPLLSKPRADGSPSPGYLKMSFTPELHKLISWYDSVRNTSTRPHVKVPGGFLNDDKVKMDRVDLDHFPQILRAIKLEIRQILQWWTELKMLKHTVTFGVRIYRRGSLLINHVDRKDTHLLSAILQIAQDVDMPNGGWPVEMLLPHGRVAEVFLQPGELVLYEGAWIRHGRPKRFCGNAFANVFSHFAPADWNGPTDSSASLYRGVAPNRRTTIADQGIVKSNFFVEQALRADERSALPEL